MFRGNVVFISPVERDGAICSEQKLVGTYLAQMKVLSIFDQNWFILVFFDLLVWWISEIAGGEIRVHLYE